MGTMAGMVAPNFVDKTIWTGDNLDILRGLNSETVDLIYLDPPFNSNKNYEAPVGSKAAGAAFKDTWTLSDLDVAWMGLIADEHPAIAYMLDAAGKANGKGMQSYLTMMAVRLLEMHRVLKDTGSIYLHCDPYASHYLKMLMDAIFGAGNFRSEIIWKRTHAHSGSKRFGPVHDTILFYSKSNIYTWVPQHTDYSEQYKERFFKFSDPDGRRYRSTILTGSGTRNGASGKPWRGIDPTKSGRHWAIPSYTRTLLRDGLDSDVQSSLDKLDAIGRVLWPSKEGGTPSFKQYIDDMLGVAIQDVWTDIAPIASQAKERINYPTQKPLSLLERIIKASANPGDVVLDPFCGCATACVAADKLGRQWVGIDISPKAAELVNERLMAPTPLGIGPMFHNRYVTHRTDIPRRTDIDAPIPYRQNKHVLYGQQEGQCGGCKLDFPFKVMEVDHVVPSSRGGSDHMDNLQLLCGHCNRTKGDRPQEYLVARLSEIGV